MANYPITDFGAQPDGATLATKAIQTAIDTAHAAGGGRVIVPTGHFLSGTIELRSHVELHLESGAVLQGSPNLTDYTFQHWGFHKDRTPWHFIFALNQQDIAITGRGTIDGNGPAFWQKERPSEWHFWREKHERPTPMVEIQGCQDVLIENVRLANPPGWTLHPFDCDRVQIRGIRIETDLFGPNSDGIDVNGCADVTISDCYIRAGDDAIALKSYRDSDGPRACERIAVTNCILETNCVAVRLGFDGCWDFRDIVVSNCVVKRASRVIDLRMIEGATIENVRIEGIVGNTNCGWPMTRPIEITAANVPNALGMFEGHPNYGKDFPPTGSSAVRHVTLRDIDLETDGRITLAATPECEIRDILLDNVRLRYPLIDDPSTFRQPEGWNGDSGFLPQMPHLVPVRAALVAENIQELEVRGFRVEWPTGPVPAYWMLLDSAHRRMNPLYLENPDEVRQGLHHPPFSAIWANRVSGLIESRRLTGHGEAEAIQAIDSPALSIL